MDFNNSSEQEKHVLIKVLSADKHMDPWITPQSQGIDVLL